MNLPFSMSSNAIVTPAVPRARVLGDAQSVAVPLRSVAASDGDRSLSTPLTRYYADEGPRGVVKAAPP